MAQTATSTNGSETKVGIAKKLEIMIKPGKLQAVKDAMEKAGYTGVTVSQAEGHGNQKGKSHASGGFRLDLLPKVRIEIVVPASDVEALIKGISAAAATGEPGDGKIFVSDITEVIRIRTGERGLTAL